MQQQPQQGGYVRGRLPRRPPASRIQTAWLCCSVEDDCLKSMQQHQALADEWSCLAWQCCLPRPSSCFVQAEHQVQQCLALQTGCCQCRSPAAPGRTLRCCNVAHAQGGAGNVHRRLKPAATHSHDGRALKQNFEASPDVSLQRGITKKQQS